MAFENIKSQIQSALKDKVTETLSNIGLNTRVSKKGTIDNFISTLNRSGGMARANKYEIVLDVPGHPGGNDNRLIELHCSTVTMPGHNLEQHTQRLASAPAREIVQGHTYAGNITATFYLDVNLETKIWFDAWQEMTFDRNTHKAKYYDEYVGTMQIYQLDANGSHTYGIECDEVYPATIGQIEYAYESTDTIATLPIEFAYRKWTDVEDLNSGTIYGGAGEFLGYSYEDVTELKDYMRAKTTGYQK